MMGMTMAQTPKTPSVSIENVTLTAPTSVSFNIVVNDDCDKYLYLISDTSFFQLAAAFGMTHAQFMELMPQYGIEWVTATTGQVDNYTSSDLEPNSTYGIYVLAKNAQGESFVAEHLFTTSIAGGSGTAELTMTLTNPTPDTYQIEVAINDQTAYYWYSIFDEPVLQQLGYSSAADMTTQQFYDLMDRLVNDMELSYLVHSSALTEEMPVEEMEVGVDYVAVAFPFNADGILGTYTEPIHFSHEVGVNDYSRVEMNIWPNPASDYVNVSADSDIQSVRVMDLQGHLVLNEQCEGQEVRINISSLSAGAYVVSIHTNGVVVSKPMIVTGK